MPAERRAVLVKTLRDQRRATLLWAVGFAVVAVVYMSYFTQIQADPSIVKSVQDLPGGLSTALDFTDLASAPGYLRATVFGLLGPLLMVMFAVMAGARSVAGEEESGLLDVYLSHPLTRRRLVLERFAAMTGQILLLAAVLWAVVALLDQAQGLGVGVDRLLAASLALALLGLCFGSVALAVGGATGGRTAALATGAGVAVGTYLLNAVVSQLDAVRWLRLLSPFNYVQADDPLVHGFRPGLLVLAAVPAVLLGLTLLAFDRRDLRV